MTAREIALEVVEILREQGLVIAAPAAGSSYQRYEDQAAPELLTAAQVAQRFGLRREWVYDHAERLGAIRLGDVGEGKRPRMRFDPQRVMAALVQPAPCEDTRRSGVPEVPVPVDAPARRRKRPNGASAQLLPIRGRDA